VTLFAFCCPNFEDEKPLKMNRFQLPGPVLIIYCLFVISCGNNQPEAEDDFPTDPETARIGGELYLINLSQDAKSHTWTFGEGSSFTRTEGAPTQATKIRERTFYVCPIARNPRLHLIGKIRFEVCSEMKDYNPYESPPNKSNEISRNPDFNPQ